MAKKQKPDKRLVTLAEDDLCRLSESEEEIQGIMEDFNIKFLRDRLSALQETYQNAINSQSFNSNSAGQYVYVGPIFEVGNPRGDTEKLFLPLILRQGLFHNQNTLYGRIFPLDYSALIVDNKKSRSLVDFGAGIQLEALLSGQTSANAGRISLDDAYEKYKELFDAVQKSLKPYGIKTTMLEAK